MSKRVIHAVLLVLVAMTAVASDDNPCPCIPISKVWVVTSCETWNCAQAAMILAGGDPYVMAVPTGDTKYGWVVARRVVAGTVATEPPDPYVINSYPTASDGVTHYTSADPNTFPMMITAIDGTTLVLKLREPAGPGRRRVAGR